MAKRRVVKHLTVEEYMASRRAEEAASKSAFTFNNRTKELKVNFAKLEELVKAASKSKKVCRPSEKAVTVDDLN